jgi:RNA polymerase sigma-70 factor (ECF subfamily)
MTEPVVGEPTTREVLAFPPEAPLPRVSPSFDAFYLRELPSLVSLARALTGSASAEDIAQEAMLATYRRWPEIEVLDSPPAWVRRVCANLATSFLRRRAAEGRAVLRIAGMHQRHAELPQNDEAFWAEVRRLPRRQAQAISLHYVYDMQVSDIALTLDCSQSAVKAHLGRGRAALAKRLGIEGEGQS